MRRFYGKMECVPRSDQPDGGLDGKVFSRRPRLGPDVRILCDPARGLPENPEGAFTSRIQDHAGNAVSANAPDRLHGQNTGNRNRIRHADKRRKQTFRQGHFPISEDAAGVPDEPETAPRPRLRNRRFKCPASATAAAGIRSKSRNGTRCRICR